ncbi:MAG: hypothetical protein SFX72_19410 [Isosphaeraceae bacterium]|nr:hypothetical protein [Isosphaeraceae bacterium]
MITLVRTLLVVSALLAANVEVRGDITLFDGTLGTTPGAQGWLYLTNPVFGAKATQTPGPSGTILDTQAVQTEQAGWFSRLGGFAHPSMPTLDRSLGFTVRLDLAVLAESHASIHRAGFSLIVLGQDLRGIELGFWTDRIWAQSDNPLFTRAEEAIVDTTASAGYLLSVAGNQYTLYRNGGAILDGPLRDYSSFGTPYNTPSFIFVGDDTSSASARVNLAGVGVSLTAVPEPGAWRLFASGIGGVVAIEAVRRRRLNPFGTRDRYPG